MESVYVTSPGVGRLVGAYEEQLGKTMKEHAERVLLSLQSLPGMWTSPHLPPKQLQRG